MAYLYSWTIIGYISAIIRILYAVENEGEQNIKTDKLLCSTTVVLIYYRHGEIIYGHKADNKRDICTLEELSTQHNSFNFPLSPKRFRIKQYEYECELVNPIRLLFIDARISEWPRRCFDKQALRQWRRKRVDGVNPFRR